MPLQLYGRTVSRHKVFPAEPTDFAAWYSAIAWLKQSGFNCGKLDYPGPTAFVVGAYTLPQKWSELSADQRATVAGILTSRDPKRLEVNVYFFE